MTKYLFLILFLFLASSWSTLCAQRKDTTHFTITLAGTSMPGHLTAAPVKESCPLCDRVSILEGQMEFLMRDCYEVHRTNFLQSQSIDSLNHLLSETRSKLDSLVNVMKMRKPEADSSHLGEKIFTSYGPHAFYQNTSGSYNSWVGEMKAERIRLTNK